MRLAPRHALFVLPLLLGSPAPAQEMEVEVGTRLICDTQEQVERFVALYDGDAERTVERVNSAVHDPSACGVSTMAYVRGTQLGTARNKDSAFEIAPILVLGVVTNAGVRSVKPARYFSAFELDEIPV
jgi:hypothetical protein